VATIKLQNLANSRRDTPRARSAAGSGFLLVLIVCLLETPGLALHFVIQAQWFAARL
jgi:hypothetical protein